MTRKHFLAGLASLLLVLPASAQIPSDTRKEFPFAFGPVGLSTLMKEAGLSEEQMRQFQQIFQDNRHRLVDLRGEVEKKEGDLKFVLDQSQVDLGQAEKTLDALLEARKQLSKATSMMMVRMRQVVTLDQWRKIGALQHELAAPHPPAPPAHAAPPAPGAAPSPRPGQPPAPPRRRPPEEVN